MAAGEHAGAGLVFGRCVSKQGQSAGLLPISGRHCYDASNPPLRGQSLCVRDFSRLWVVLGEMLLSCHVPVLGMSRGWITFLSAASSELACERP